MRRGTTLSHHGRARAAVAVALAFALTLIPAWPAAAAGRARARPFAGPALTADAAALVDASTGRLLWGLHPFARRAPASTTKIMTAILAIELGRPDDRVTVTREAASTEGSSARLKAGDRYRLDELLKGLLLASGNDAAVAIAEHIAGSVASFADLMNQRARQLGLLDTHFSNPHGLTAPQHHSSAYDLALLAREALRLKRFSSVVRLPEAEFSGVDARERAVARRLRNTNRLLLSYGWADGVKTGTTAAAGSCLVASATRGGQRLIAVVLHSDNRWNDALQLLEYGFRHFSFVTVAQAGVRVRSLPVTGGIRPYVGLVAATPLSVAVPVGELARLRVVTSVAPAAAAPVRRGQVLGSVAAVAGDQLLGRVRLVASSAVRAASWSARLWVWLRSLLGWL